MVTILADAAEHDAGFDDAHAVGMARRQAGRLPYHAVDVLDPAAAYALDVMVVVLDSRLVAGAGRIGQADLANQSASREVVDDLVDGLGGCGGDRLSDPPVDGLGIGVRVAVKKVQHGDTTGGRSQTVSAQRLSPIAGLRMVFHEAENSTLF